MPQFAAQQDLCTSINTVGHLCQSHPLEPHVLQLTAARPILHLHMMALQHLQNYPEPADTRRKDVAVLACCF